MECLLWRLLISSRSVSKNGHHMQFLFLIGRFLKKPFPLKLLSHMNRNLERSTYMYGRFCIKFPQSRMKGERHWAEPLVMVYIPECKQQLMNYEIIYTDTRYCPVLYLGCSFNTLRDPCNNQWHSHRCDIAWFHVANH